MSRAVAVMMIWLGAAGGAAAQDRPEYRVPRAAQPPKIDGVLDDQVWQQEPLPLGEWRSYNPLRGDAMPAEFRTEIRIAYDDRNLYFAFHCFDTEPGKIRSTISRRDTAFNDDWIAMSLDSTATGQTAYHLFSNANGSQMDALNTSASGEQFDADMVWYSVGKVTSDGYVVEIQLPLQTIRFKSGDDVRMGILFFRKISRSGVSYSFPDLPPGQWVFERHARLVFDHLTQPRLIEALPSITYGVSQSRETVARWNPADGTPNLGMSGKYGVTSTITLDGTINPDFSQVESDAFQIQVNQRYPIFFSEKRPFFMEGMGLFNVSGNGDNMRTAVHTRRIVNPFWGTKVIGTAGKTTFGVLNALDESPPDIGERGERIEGFNKLFTIGRATYALRRSDYVGAILTDTEHAGRRNTVAGADISFKPTSPQQISAMFLSSHTADSIDGSFDGAAAAAGYNFEKRRYSFSARGEHYDQGFQMDTAFYNRTGFWTTSSSGDLSFYPKTSGNWLQRISPYVYGRVGHDNVQHGDEHSFQTGLRFNFTRQGFFEVAHARATDPWRGQEFDNGRDFNIVGAIQALRWFNVFGAYGQGPGIFFDPIAPYQGWQRDGFGEITLQPNQHLTQGINVSFIQFDRAETRARVYDVTIVNLKTTYQFDKHFLVRLLEQFDSSSHRLLTDLLASYELV